MLRGLRVSTSLFTELRELIFARATEGVSRRISLQTFRHLHDLSLRFHLERQTGGMTRDIERGTRAGDARTVERLEGGPFLGRRPTREHHEACHLDPRRVVRRHAGDPDHHGG